MKKLISLTSLLMLAGSAVANPWTGYKHIVSLESSSSGTEIRLEAPHNGACTELTAEGGKVWTKIDADQANADQLMQIVLMAFAANKKVDIYCADDAQWARLSNIKVGQ